MVGERRGLGLERWVKEDDVNRGVGGEIYLEGQERRRGCKGGNRRGNRRRGGMEAREGWAMSDER